MTKGEQEPRRPLDIQWSDRAKDDIAAIGDYIAAYNPAAAMRWVDRLIADVERAAEMPLAGRVVPEYAERHDIREVIRRTYRIVYLILTAIDRNILLFWCFVSACRYNSASARCDVGAGLGGGAALRGRPRHDPVGEF